ncbi:MAG: molybdate ABC transporter substrate-binding protein [Paracoccaceae bacterium]
MRGRLLVCFVVLMATQVRADEVLVAVAANYAGAFEVVSDAFTDATGHQVVVTTGATGKLFAQISQGAPFDVMLAADEAVPARIEAEGLGVAGSRFTYAIGGLSLWSADVGRALDDPKAALAAADVMFVAIANPELAPYGVAAREAMQAMGVWEAVQPKIVMGENVGQTFAMVQTGAAQIGFVATSAVVGQVRWDVPQEMFTPIRQQAVLLNAGAENAAAVALMAFLRTDAARAIAGAHGYGTE